MISTLFPNDKPLDIKNIENVIKIARASTVKEFVFIVNPYDAERMRKGFEENEEADKVFMYESELVDKGMIYIANYGSTMNGLMRGYLQRNHRSIHQLSVLAPSEPREITKEERIKNIKASIKKSKNYLERKNLQRELNELTRNRRRKA